MKKWVIKNSRQILTGIALYQILGGIVCLVFIFMQVGIAKIFTSMLVSFPLLCLFLLSIFAGYSYFRKGKENRFLTATYITLWLQVFQVSILGFSFSYYYGPYIAFGFDDQFNILFRANILDVYTRLSVKAGNSISLLVNFFPLLLLLLIDWIEKNPVREKFSEFPEK